MTKSQRIKTTYQKFGKSLDHLISLIPSFELNETQTKSLYKRISYCDITTINRAFRWYVYEQDNHTPWDFLRTIVKRCDELYYPPSQIEIDGVKMGLVNVIGGVENYLPLEELAKRNIETDAKKRILDSDGPPVKRKSWSEYKGLLEDLTKTMAIPKEQKVNAENQIKKLKEMINGE